MHLGHISGVPRVYLGCISGVSRVYLGCISGARHSLKHLSRTRAEGAVGLKSRRDRRRGRLPELRHLEKAEREREKCASRKETPFNAGANCAFFCAAGD